MVFQKNSVLSAGNTPLCSPSQNGDGKLGEHKVLPYQWVDGRDEGKVPCR